MLSRISLLSRHSDVVPILGARHTVANVSESHSQSLSLWNDYFRDVTYPMWRGTTEHPHSADPVQLKLDSTPVMKGKGVFGHVKPTSPEQDVQQASSAEAPPPPAATHLRPSAVPQPGAVENSASPKSLSQALEPKIQEDQATTSDAQIGTDKPSGELPDAVSGDPPVVAVQEGVGDESSSIGPEDSSSAPSSAKTAESLVSGVQAEGDQGVLQRPSRVRVKPGETITGIARQWYPQNPQAGLLEILRANPRIVDANLIRPGQVLKLTESAP